MNLKKDFGKRLKELRTQKGITQYQLAEMSGIDPKHMSHIETGRSFPKADLIERFATALDTDYASFFQTKHLQERNILLTKIHESLSSATDKQIRIIFKIVQDIVD